MQSMKPEQTMSKSEAEISDLEVSILLDDLVIYSPTQPTLKAREASLDAEL